MMESSMSRPSSTSTYPAGAAKIQEIDDTFMGVRTATTDGSMASGVADTP